MNDGEAKIDWVAGYAFSNKNEPDIKRTRYIRDESDTTQYFMLFADNADLSSQSQMWLNLREDLMTASVNFKKELDFSGFKPEFRTGIYLENKVREFTARNFGWSTAGNLSDFNNSPSAPAPPPEA